MNMKKIIYNGILAFLLMTSLVLAGSVSGTFTFEVDDDVSDSLNSKLIEEGKTSDEWASDILRNIAITNARDEVMISFYEEFNRIDIECQNGNLDLCERAANALKSVK